MSAGSTIRTNTGSIGSRIGWGVGEDIGRIVWITVGLVLRISIGVMTMGLTSLNNIICNIVSNSAIGNGIFDFLCGLCGPCRFLGGSTTLF